MAAMSPAAERRLLQSAIALAALLPVYAGLAGLLQGAGLAGDGSLLGRDGDSHWRYLSGLLLGIGIGFWTCVPRIERRGSRMRLLTLIVVLGGVGRAFGLLTAGLPSTAMLVGLAMELVVTPLLCAWQWRVAERLAG
jgi:hypothetical protein